MPMVEHANSYEAHLNIFIFIFMIYQIVSPETAHGVTFLH